MKVGVIQFPGSNCDRDVYHAVRLAEGNPEFVPWNTRDINHLDAIIIPGGFSYGDYLRAGAIASQTPVINGIKELVKEEIPILGICNGAQILGEIGLVPGIFTINKEPKFICEWTKLEIKNTKTPFTKEYKKNQIITIPIAHAEGRYYTDKIQELKDNDQIVLQFKDNNPNGSIESITGVCNETGQVCAIMPHPERASEKILGSNDGLKFFKSLIE